YAHVWSKDFWTKEVYLGVRLGARGVGAPLSGGALKQLLGLYKRSEQVLGLHDEAISNKEIGRWTEHAERLGRALNNSALYARHATSTEVAWLFQHAANGGMTDPPPSATPRRTWGAGEIESLVEGAIHNG